VPEEPEPTPISSIQQQQAEQMRVYWKVQLSSLELTFLVIDLDILYTVHRRHAYKPGYSTS